MSRILPFLFLAALGVLLGGGYLFFRRREKEQEQETLTFYNEKGVDIEQAIAQFERHLAVAGGYFTYGHWKAWHNRVEGLAKEVMSHSSQRKKLPMDQSLTVLKFEDYFLRGEKLREQFNKEFLQAERKRYQSFFEDVEGRKLDEQQRTAVLTDEDNNLVIAGAGSGKTSTIVGKVRYVIDRYKVAPQEILLISFTNKSADALASRIGVTGLEAKTFHKFGKDIITAVEGKQISLFEERQFRPLLKRYFNQLIEDPNYLSMVTDYFVNYLKPERAQSEFKTHGDYIQYLKDQNFRTYKLVEVATRKKMTYQMEVVRSIEECKIANHLLFHGVNYAYEAPYEHDTATESFRQYKPDFTILHEGKRIYLEHFGIARDGRVPAFFAQEGETQEQASARYMDGIRWKRELHRSKHTTLIETYSYEMTEGNLFENLSLRLAQVGVTLRPKSHLEIWQIILKAASDEVDGLITLFGTFITLMKSNNYQIDDVRARNLLPQGEFFRRRNDMFIDLVAPLYAQYELYLLNRGEIDFSDMINQATRYVNEGRFRRSYRYVIIDEFQDISIGRYQLVKAVKEQNPESRLFCVGDDWQSIYRFTGSDISLFKDFEKYFGYTVRSKIETTYRFNNPLLKLSSDFIQRNPNQTRKDLRGTSLTKQTSYKIHYSTPGEQDDSLAVLTIFRQLMEMDAKIENKEILVLGRYSFDFDRLKSEGYVFTVNKEAQLISYKARTKAGQIRTLNAQFMTVHRSKGLEADVVIVLNCNSGKLGFPSEMSDDPVLNLLLSDADRFDHGEERRLFYVAMTRARESVHFVTDPTFKSTFIDELEMKTGQSPNRKCPRCKRGDIIVKKAGTAKNGKGYRFYGCTNFEYGCEYSKMEWDN